MGFPMVRKFLAALVLCCVAVAGVSGEDSVYELRIYTCEPGKLDALNTRFREHTLRLFEKHGIENVAYWTPIAGAEADPRLVYVIKHRSREAANDSWKAFREDPEWKAVAQASQEAHGKILAKAPESIYMAATDYSPTIGKAEQGKVYELRIYTTVEGRLDALNARFRDHTMRIFARHGLNSFAYWVPVDEPASKNVLYYVLDSPSQYAAKAGWKAFGTDPDWQAARKASEADGKILAERPVSLYMIPTDYSPQK